MLLCPRGFSPLPKHELTDKLLANLYSEEETELVTTCFKKFREEVSKDLRFKGGSARTNFAPVIKHEDCSLCATCVDMCPIEVMSLDEDETSGKITIDRNFCIGCGVCAVNCPQEAISLEKTSNNIPVQSRPGLFGEPAQQ